MSRVDLSSAGFSKASLPNGMLQTNSALNTTLQTVKDNVGNSSTLLLSTVDAQFNSTLRIHTDSSELLDIEDTGANNRFNINRVVQQINLDFASKPTDLTTIVGAIRTAQDGVNLSNALYFKENGQATFTERLGIESDSTVTTQTSSVIQATTTNANLVLNPNGTGAIVASIPDGTATGGNARGQSSVDLQVVRSINTQVSSANNSVICGGRDNLNSSVYGFLGGGYLNKIGVYSGGNNDYAVIVGGYQNQTQGPNNYTVIVGGFGNTNSSGYGVILGGQNNTASTNTHATVVGGYSNVASGQYSVAGGYGSIASGQYSTALGRGNATNTGATAIGGWAAGNPNATGTYSTAMGQNTTASASQSVAIGGSGSNASGNGAVALGSQNTASGSNSIAIGTNSTASLYGQYSLASGVFVTNADAQQSLLTARNSAALATGATLVLSLDGTGTTNLIIPTSNRAWNVQVNWVAVVTAITGTATGVTVGDTITQVQTLGFKKVGVTSSLIGVANTLSTNSNTSMSTASMAYTAGASQELALTFTAPTFAGGGTVTCRVVARIELTEVAW